MMMRTIFELPHRLLAPFMSGLGNAYMLMMTLIFGSIGHACVYLGVMSVVNEDIGIFTFCLLVAIYLYGVIIYTYGGRIFTVIASFGPFAMMAMDEISPFEIKMMIP